MKEVGKNNTFRIMIFFFLLILGNNGFSQFNLEIFPKNSIIVEKKYDFTENETLIPAFQSFNKIFSGSTLDVDIPETIQVFNPIMKRALFCRLEDQVSKKSNIAMRMRLGSLDYVNQIEQKPNYRINLNN